MATFQDFAPQAVFILPQSFTWIAQSMTNLQIIIPIHGTFVLQTALILESFGFGSGRGSLSVDH
jgi:hypothetical protein